MDLAREQIACLGLQEPFVVMSRVQTQGRGRGGSRWSQAIDASVHPHPGMSEPQLFASFAESVEHAQFFGPCTFVLPAAFLKIPITWLSLVAGCAITDALESVRRRLENHLEFAKCFPQKIEFEPRLKWPNDVWAWPSRTGNVSTIHSPSSAKKIAGLLCESSFRSDSLQFVTIGLGLNVLMAPDLVSHAGSVLEMWGIKSAALGPKLAQLVMRFLAEDIERELLDYLCTERSAEQLRMLTIERSLPLGTRLSVNKGEQVGAFLGLTSDGALLIDGVSSPIVAADIGFQSHNEAVEEAHQDNRYNINSSVTAGIARICLDFGNTHIHWRCEQGNNIQRGDVDWSQLDRKVFQDQRLFVRTAFAQEILAAVGNTARIELVWSAVAHAGNSSKVAQSLESALVAMQPGREIGLCPLVADEILQAAGVAADYASEQMGVDRALQAWSAVKAVQEKRVPVAVLSLGTASTGLVIDAEGRLVESFILPGHAMSLAALHEKTARLPKVSLPQQWPSGKGEPPFSTALSILRGLLLQLRGVVASLIELHGVEQVILTGGGAIGCADLLRKEFKIEFTVDDDFVLKSMSDFFSQQTRSRYRLMSDDGESEAGLPEKVLQSMLRARLSRRRSQRVALDRKYFRRLGGRLEHVGVGLRLDRHLGERFKFHTRDVWQERVDIGEVLIEQNSPKNHTSDEAPSTLINIKSTYVLKHGDQIWLFHPPEYEPDMMTHVEVVYDDGDAAVFCKPGNLVVHAAGLYGKNTFIEITKKMGYGNAAPVHRIDRETSGLLVCARSTPLRRDLSLSFRDASVKKMYLAVTRGQTHVPEQFRIDFPIGPAAGSRIRLKLWHNSAEGLDALTHCVRLAQWQDYSLFACMPQTGRTNQIRAHLAALGQWIVGDKMYHPDEEVFLHFYEEGFTDFVSENVLLPRHWLHNTGIQFFSRPDCRLGRAPVIAPLTEDLLVHEPTLELLKAAGLPVDPAEQKTAFAELFTRMLGIDFSKTPVVRPEGR